MKNLFPSHYVKRDEAFFARLFKEGTIVFDANVLLSFFRYSDKTRKELFGILSDEQVRPRLWIPFQVAREYHDHLRSVRLEPITACAKLRTALEKERSALKAEIHRERVQRLLDLLTEETKRAQDHYDADIEWVEKISDLFDGRVGPQFSEEELSEIYKEGETRFAKKIPPGFRDKDKGDARRYGDLVLWKELLRFAPNKLSTGMIFVTDDGKDDWWEQNESGQNLGPSPMLCEEVERHAPGMPFHIYSGKMFIERANKHASAKVGTEAVEEMNTVREVVNEQKRKPSIRDLIESLKEGGLAPRPQEESALYGLLASSPNPRGFADALLRIKELHAIMAPTFQAAQNSVLSPPGRGNAQPAQPYETPADDADNNEPSA